MSRVASDFETSRSKLAAVLRRQIAGFESLVSAERLSGGASQETYRLVIRDATGERRLAMRRSPGGVESIRTPGHPGLPTEAALMRFAREAGVPEPEVYAVFTAGDGLGDGFVMQWLDGEALGARIVRSESLAEVRPKLAFECGQILARIHAIDLKKPAAPAVARPVFFRSIAWMRARICPHSNASFGRTPASDSERTIRAPSASPSSHCITKPSPSPSPGSNTAYTSGSGTPASRAQRINALRSQAGMARRAHALDAAGRTAHREPAFAGRIANHEPIRLLARAARQTLGRDERLEAGDLTAQHCREFDLEVGRRHALSLRERLWARAVS